MREGVFIQPMHDALWAEHLGVDLKAGPSAPESEPRLSERFDEIYLQLMLVDLDDETAVLSWVNEFGLLEIHEKSILSLSLHESRSDHSYRRLSGYPLFDDESEEYLRAIVGEAERRRSAAGFDAALAPHFRYPVTLEEFRWAARCIRDLARAYWCLSTESDPALLTWENPLIDFCFGPENEEEIWWDAYEMQVFVAETLSLGLLGFSPRVIVDDKAIAELRGRQRSSALSEQFAASNDLFAICCLELFNHIVEEAAYQTCANETCARWFVRQQGRSVHDQRRRSGVRFCSYSCARQQTQRAYHRRRRANKGAPET